MAHLPYPLTGTNRLDAPAGAGKTQTAQGITHEITESGIPLSMITGLSFTRIGARTLAARVESGSTDDDLKNFRTIHSMCYRLLGLNKKQVLSEKQLKQFFADEIKLAFVGARHDADMDEAAPIQQRSNSPGNDLLAFYEWQRNRMLPFEDAFRVYRPTSELRPYWTLDTISRLLLKYEAFKADLGVLDFTDMLVNTLEQGLHPDTRALLVDEFQDCTTLQVELVKAWGQTQQCVWTFGDTDQAIYTFLGTNVRDFLSFPGEQFILDTNYRSGANIVDFSAKLIGRNVDRVQKHIRAARLDAGTVRRLPMLPKLDWQRSTFVLARTNYLLVPIALELESQGVPFTMRRGSLGIPQQLDAPAYAAFRAALALRGGRHVTAQQLSTLYSFIRNSSRAMYTAHGSKKRVEDIAAREKYLPQPETLIALQDLPSFGGLPALIDALRADAPELLSRAEPQRLGYWRRVVKQYGEDVLYNKPAITLSTVHGVKGDEADLVYLLPDVSARIAESIYRTREERESERRVFYVACTRARDELYVLNPRTSLYYTEVLNVPRKAA